MKTRNLLWLPALLSLVFCLSFASCSDEDGDYSRIPVFEYDYKAYTADEVYNVATHAGRTHFEFRKTGEIFFNIGVPHAWVGRKIDLKTTSDSPSWYVYLFLNDGNTGYTGKGLLGETGDIAEGYVYTKQIGEDDDEYRFDCYVRFTDGKEIRGTYAGKFTMASE